MSHRVPVYILAAALFLSGCGKGLDYDYKYDHSYSISPVKVIPSFDCFNQLDYQFKSYSIRSYSSITVCFRRIGSSGYPKSYGEIVDTRDNPNTYQTYHTYKKLAYDETGVVLRWVDLTDSHTGKVTRYVNY